MPALMYVDQHPGTGRIPVVSDIGLVNCKKKKYMRMNGYAAVNLTVVGSLL